MRGTSTVSHLVRINNAQEKAVESNPKDSTAFLFALNLNQARFLERCVSAVFVNGFDRFS